MRIAIVLLTLSPILLVTEAAMCQKRRIIDTPNLRLWCFGYKHLLRIEIKSTEDVEDIVLTKNNVTEVDERSFEVKNNSVKKIFLDFNSISTINGDAFKQFPNLEMIDLNHNRLRRLEPATFHSNKKLKTIDLSWNYIEVLSVEFVLPFKNLEKFILSNNNLRVCEDKTKETLAYLARQAIEIYSLSRCTGAARDFSPIETNDVQYLPPIITEKITEKEVTSEQTLIKYEEKGSHVVYLILSILFLSLLLITAIVGMSAINSYKKHSYPSRRVKTISGTYLLSEEDKNSIPEDCEGYLEPTVPKKIPQYLQILEDTAMREAPSQPIYPESAPQHVYEEVKDFYNANINMKRLQPYAVTTLIKK